MFPERVGPQHESILIRTAAAVESDLRLVGLSVVQGGDCNAGIQARLPGSFLVFYDTVTGDSNGVFVTWNASTDTENAVLASPSGPQRAIDMSGATLDSMLDAAETILRAGGWHVDRLVTGVHESSIKVYSHS